MFKCYSLHSHIIERLDVVGEMLSTIDSYLYEQGGRKLDIIRKREV